MAVAVKDPPKTSTDASPKTESESGGKSIDPSNKGMMDMVGSGAAEGDGPFDFLKKSRAKRKAKKEEKKKKKEAEKQNKGDETSSYDESGNLDIIKIEAEGFPDEQQGPVKEK